MNKSANSTYPMFFIFATLVMLLLFSGSTLCAATFETISQDNSNTVFGFAPDETAQSFTPTIDGYITSIEVASNTAGASTLKIYDGDATIGDPIVYTQGVNLTDTVSATGTNVTGYTYQEIVLSTPQPVTAGQEYTFGFTNWDAAWYDTTLPGVYTGGRMMTYNGGFWSASGADDLTFRVHILKPDPVSVPALSEWGTMLFSCILVVVALFRGRLKQREPRW